MERAYPLTFLYIVVRVKRIPFMVEGFYLLRVSIAVMTAANSSSVHVAPRSRRESVGMDISAKAASFCKVMLAALRALRTARPAASWSITSFFILGMGCFMGWSWELIIHHVNLSIRESRMVQYRSNGLVSCWQ